MEIYTPYTGAAGLYHVKFVGYTHRIYHIGLERNKDTTNTAKSVSYTGLHLKTYREGGLTKNFSH
jgi:hypothetical protein